MHLRFALLLLAGFTLFPVAERSHARDPAAFELSSPESINTALDLSRLKRAQARPGSEQWWDATDDLLYALYKAQDWAGFAGTVSDSFDQIAVEQDAGPESTEELALRALTVLFHANRWAEARMIVDSVQSRQPADPETEVTFKLAGMRADLGLGHIDAASRTLDELAAHADKSADADVDDSQLSWLLDELRTAFVEARSGQFPAMSVPTAPENWLFVPGYRFFRCGTAAWLEGVFPERDAVLRAFGHHSRVADEALLANWINLINETGAGATSAQVLLADLDRAYGHANVRSALRAAENSVRLRLDVRGPVADTLLLGMRLPLPVRIDVQSGDEAEGSGAESAAQPIDDPETLRSILRATALWRAAFPEDLTAVTEFSSDS